MWLKLNTNMKHIKLLAIGVVAFALVGGIWTLFIPLPPGTETRTGLFTQLGFSFAMFVLFIGSSIIMLLGLKNFSDKLKTAYSVLCIGIMLIALAQMQVPLFTLLDMMQTPYVRFGPIVLPFIVGVIAVFLGVRAIARLFEVRGVLASVWFFFAATLVGATLVTLLPHGTPASEEIAFDSSTALPAWTDVGVAISILLLLKIKRKASVQYANAFAWLVLGLGTTLVVSVGYVCTALVLGDLHWVIKDGFVYALFTVAGIILVRAGYAFYTIPEQAVVTSVQAVNFFGKPKKVEPVEAASSVDIVTYAASLASNPAAVDFELDSVRFVTSRYADNTNFSSEDTATLREAYLKIEEYLVSREPVRKFDRPTLRRHIQEKLHLDNLSPTFWKDLSGTPTAQPTA
jgi:hypothetical protein